MPFDPAQPADDSDLSSEVMRNQLNALNDDLQTRPTTGEMNSADAALLAQTSNNTNNVSLLQMSADGSYQQWQMQAVMDKLDELLSAARRT